MKELMPPLVSIVTPSYNQAQFIEATIQSVLSQDYPKIEYIIMDGGSKDGSVEIIHRYAGRLAWWVSERDRGQTDAINKGFAHANGEILAWLNSDDIYHPGAISEAVAHLTAHPETGMVYGDAALIDDQGRTFAIQLALGSTRHSSCLIAALTSGWPCPRRRGRG